MERKYEMKIQEEEISLVDLFVILYKHRLFILTTTIIITLGSLGGALYLRANKDKEISVNFSLENKLDSFYTAKANLNLGDIDVKNALKNNEILNSIYELKDLSLAFKESGSDDTQLEKREFLEKHLIQNPVLDDNKKLLYYKLSVKGIKNVNYENILDKYIETLNKDFKLKYVDSINNKYNKVKEDKENYAKELVEANNKVKIIISKESKEVLASEKAMEILKTEYPKEFENQEKISELYKKYDDELLGLEGIKNDPSLNERIVKVSSFYEIKAKSKAKLVLAGGIVLGFILGILGAFVLEFWQILKVEIKRK